MIKYVYCTTNILNGMIYIGKHTDDSENGFDDYLGSGVFLRWAIDDFGKNAFKKEILEIFETDIEALFAEKWYIEYYRSLGFNSLDTMYNISNGDASVGGVKYAFITEEEFNLIKRPRSSKTKVDYRCVYESIVYLSWEDLWQQKFSHLSYSKVKKYIKLNVIPVTNFTPCLLLI